MELLLHTIALEPARWTPQRVQRPLADLAPAIAAAGFRGLEIFEPHLTLAPAEKALPEILAAHGLQPVVLSSYLQFPPAVNPDELFHRQGAELLARVRRFGFRKVRLFPGASPSPEQTAATIDAVAGRVRWLADECPAVEFLFETHDGGLADEPAAIVDLVAACGRKNVGILWQPTVFESEAARTQLVVQKPLIRHLHLQNRWPDLGFARLEAGVVPWAAVLAELDFNMDASLEFVPAGICAPDEFDLDAALAEAVAETRYVRGLAAAHRASNPR